MKNYIYSKSNERVKLLQSNYNLVVNKVVDFIEFYKGTQIPIIMMDILGYSYEELKRELELSNQLKMNLKRSCSNLDRPFKDYYNTISVCFIGEMINDFIKKSDETLDILKEELYSDFRFLINKKSYPRYVAIAIIMKNICNTCINLEKEFTDLVKERNPSSEVKSNLTWIKRVNTELNSFTKDYYNLVHLDRKIRKLTPEYDKTKTEYTSQLDFRSIT